MRPAADLPRRASRFATPVDVDRLQARLVLFVVGDAPGQVETVPAPAQAASSVSGGHVAHHPLDGQAVERVARPALEDAHGAALLEQARDEVRAP